MPIKKYFALPTLRGALNLPFRGGNSMLEANKDNLSAMLITQNKLKKEVFYYEGTYNLVVNEKTGVYGPDLWARVRVKKTTFKKKKTLGQPNQQRSKSVNKGSTFKENLNFFVSLYSQNNEISDGYRFDWTVDLDKFKADVLKNKQITPIEGAKFGKTSMGPMTLPVYKYANFGFTFELKDPAASLVPEILSTEELKLKVISKIVTKKDPKNPKQWIKEAVPICKL